MSSRGAPLPDRRAVPDHHAGVQDRHHGAAGDDAGAVSPVPPHPDLRAPGRPGPRDPGVFAGNSPHRGRGRPHPAAVRRGGPDARGVVSGRPHRRAVRRRAGRRADRGARDDRVGMGRAALRRRVRVCRRRPPRAVPEGSHLALLALCLLGAAPPHLEHGAPLPGGLAVRAGPGPHRARADPAGRRRAVPREPPVLPGRRPRRGCSRWS